MNLFFRLIRVLLISRWGLKLGVLDTSLIKFQVMPSDLDILRHMNNGKYFSIMDLGRVDFLIRSGIWSRLQDEKWYPVVVSETIRFKRSFKVFDRFELSTQTLGWDEKYFYLEQKFVRGHQLYAIATVKARFLKTAGGTVTPGEVIALIGDTTVSPPMAEFIAHWQKAEDGQLAIPEKRIRTGV